MTRATEGLEKIENWLNNTKRAKYFKYNGTTPNGIVFTLDNRLFSIIPHGITEDKTKRTYVFSEWTKGAKESDVFGFTSCVSENYVIVTVEQIFGAINLIYYQPMIYKWENIKQLCEENN